MLIGQNAKEANKMKMTTEYKITVLCIHTHTHSLNLSLPPSLSLSLSRRLCPFECAVHGAGGSLD